VSALAGLAALGAALGIGALPSQARLRKIEAKNRAWHRDVLEAHKRLPVGRVDREPICVDVDWNPDNMLTNPKNMVEASEALRRFEDDVDLFLYQLNRKRATKETPPGALRTDSECSCMFLQWDALSGDKSGSQKSVLSAIVNMEKGTFDRTPVGGLTADKFSREAVRIGDKMEALRKRAHKKCPRITAFKRISEQGRRQG
jgi:hypothetical protein